MMKMDEKQVIAVVGFLAAGIITMIKAERRKKNGKNIYHIDRDKALFWK